MMIQNILTLLGGFSVIVAAIAWLARTLISQLFLRDVERYKSDLLHLTEEFKSELSIQVKEREVRFIALHEKRASIIVELYGLLADVLLSRSALSFVIGMSQSQLEPSDQKTIEDVHHKFRHIEKLFIRNRIYFSKHFVEEFEKILNDLMQPVFNLEIYTLRTPDDAKFQELCEDLDSGFLKSEKLLNLTEDEFRTVLGVKNNFL